MATRSTEPVRPCSSRGSGSAWKAYPSEPDPAPVDDVPTQREPGERNDTDTAHDIAIAVGSCIDSTFAFKLELSSVLTKQIDAAWSVGDDAGGLDTGAVANSTWYYIWLIKKDSDSSIDALFSTSATSPTMPAGYTYKRRIRGAVLTDGSANILGFEQKV